MLSLDQASLAELIVADFQWPDFDNCSAIVQVFGNTAGAFVDVGDDPDHDQQCCRRPLTRLCRYCN